MMVVSALRSLAGVFLLLVASSLPADAIDPNEIRVAFLFNFSKFTEWPDDAFGDADAPFVIAVCGNTELAQLMRDAVRGRRVHDRRLEVRAVERPVDSPEYHLLYVANVSPSLLARMAESRSPAVLSVGEGSEFLDAGGVVGLVENDGRIQFVIDLDRARKARLSLSSKLLSLASQVRYSNAGRD